MQELDEALSELTGSGKKQSQPAAAAVQEQREGYRLEARELIMDILKYDPDARVVRPKTLKEAVVIRLKKSGQAVLIRRLVRF